MRKGGMGDGRFVEISGVFVDFFALLFAEFVAVDVFVVVDVVELLSTVVELGFAGLSVPQLVGSHLGR
jgi:hypothetical protein